MRSFSILLIVGSLIFLAACGGGSSTPQGLPVTVSLSPSTAQTINGGGSVNITAAVANDSTNSGVTWSLSPSGTGSLTNVTTTSVTYKAPASVPQTTTVTVTATSKATSSASASLQITILGPTVSLSPAAPQTLNQAGTLSITASPANTGTTNVTWTPPTVGSLSSTTGTTVTYTAPSSVTGNTTVKITATSGSASNFMEITVLPSGAGPNVAALNVNGGPVAGTIYANGVFTSVAVCVPGSNPANCQTVDDVLVDTGSVGLRVLASAIPNIAGALPVETFTDGSPINECVQFLDGSYLWGTVAQADIRIAGEVASGAPTQIVADPSGFSIPALCTTNGAGADEDNQAGLLANGILGVGPEPFDCGEGCDPNGGNASPPAPLYYASCTSSAGCQPVFVTCGSLCGDSPEQQVENPVFGFVPSTDSNGVAIQMQAVNSAAATATGSLIFGIGTESNNGLNTATVLTLNTSDEFTTDFQGQTLVASFIDSGSNGLFFPNWPNLPMCTNNTSFFCPTSLQTYPVTNTGVSGLSSISVNVDNAIGLSADAGDAAFSNLAGPEQAGSSPATCQNTNPPTGDCTFDFGFSFFYNRTVFTAIDTTTAGGILGPFVAY